MTLVFGQGDMFATLKIQDPNFTDGFALVTLGFTNVVLIDTELAESIATTYGDIFAEVMWNSSAIVECQVYDETTSATWTGSIPGTAPSAPVLAVNSALLVKKAAAGRGRRFRGRNFLPAILNEGAVFGDGTIDSSFRSDLESRVSAFYLGFVTLGITPAIPQGEQQDRKDGSPGTLPILPWPEIVDVGVDAKIATQRRRLRR